MIPTVIDDHTAQGLARLIEKYKDKSKLRALLSSYLNRIQEIEDLLWEIINEQLLDNAVGVQLDIWGKLVKQPRVSDDDDIYRLFIKAKIIILRSHGRTDDYIKVLFAILGEDFAFRVRDVYPHQVRIYLDDASPYDPNVIAQLLGKTRAATITLRLLASDSFASTNKFRFRYGPNTSDPAQGWNSGKLANVIQP